MLLIKAIALLLAAISIIKSYLDFRKKREPQLMFVFWTIVWIVAAVLVVYPLLIERLFAYTKDQSVTLGSIMSLAFIFMLYIVYRVYAKAARIEYQQAELIRKLGLAKSLKRGKKPTA